MTSTSGNQEYDRDCQEHPCGYLLHVTDYFEPQLFTSKGRVSELWRYWTEASYDSCLKVLAGQLISSDLTLQSRYSNRDQLSGEFAAADINSAESHF